MKYKEIKDRVLTNIIEEAGSIIGEDLNEVKLSVIQIRKVLYSTLKELEMETIDEEYSL